MDGAGSSRSIGLGGSAAGVLRPARAGEFDPGTSNEHKEWTGRSSFKRHGAVYLGFEMIAADENWSIAHFGCQLWSVHLVVVLP